MSSKSNKKIVKKRIFSREDFHVRISQLQVSVPVFSGIGVSYIPKCIELPKSCALDTSYLKMCRNYVSQDWSISYLTLPESGMMRNGQLYELIGLDIGTNANGYSLLPTPCASEAYKGLLSSLKAYRKYFSKSKMQNKLIYQAYLNGLTGIQTNELFLQIQGFPTDWTRIPSMQLEIPLM